MRKIAAAFLLFAFTGCQAVSENQPANRAVQNSAVQSSSETDSVRRGQNSAVDVFKLVGKNPSEIDAILGNPIESKSVTENNLAGEYRLYKLENYPKGLAVRFFQNKAASFNLILPQSFPTSREAILKSFGIDVGKGAPVTDKDEPLTEKYQGNFNGVNFSKISAKKSDDGKGFVFVLAETEK